MVEKIINKIENKLDSAFKTLNDINNKISRVKEEMNDSGIPDNRNKITK